MHEYLVKVLRNILGATQSSNIYFEVLKYLEVAYALEQQINIVIICSRLEWWSASVFLVYICKLFSISSLFHHTHIHILWENNIAYGITLCKRNIQYMLNKYKCKTTTTTKYQRDQKLNHPEKILVITRYKIPSGRTKTHISFQLPFAFSFPL